ncbi:ATP-binding protein [Crenobacter sp. SG2305]|uniref:ATP-binding protein n=1 Tax=Crenobacter oryzisoli TaxID=3056844 RepID=UPI0025AB2999|nr:ATP-binding protein [Crenobacter sp. SG2305]MDN0084156.1 ATP-binding protein [Crenobacter sp. SG2305]
MPLKKNPLKSSLPQLPSLTWVFIRYYVLAVAALVIMISGVGIVVDRLYSHMEEDNAKSFMAGTVRLIEKEYLQAPENEWPQVTHRLRRSFVYPISLEPLDRFAGQKSVYRDLREHTTVIDLNELVLYYRIGMSDQVLKLGPLTEAFGNKRTELIPAELQAQMISWLLTGLGFGLLLFLWLLPLWRDLVAVRDTAKRLADGNLAARAPAAHSLLFAPLERALNGMAERIEVQVETRQALSHAVAHEIRTPIARLRFGLTMLDEAETPAEHASYRQGLNRDIDELEELVNASLAYARLDRGEVKLEKEPVELAEWLIDLVQLVEPIVPPGVHISLDAAPYQVEFDRKLMYIATRNLLINAGKYAREQVKLTLEPAGLDYRIVVDDDGPGIPPEERERIFEPFARLDRSRDRTTGGYGLGLSFVRLIAVHHGGRVFAENSPLGGARFVLLLPRHLSDRA